MPLSTPWTPLHLGPYSWYDVHLGGSATQIVDSSRYERPAATLGAGSNAPLWLPYLGPSVHLEAATSGTNAISCTAPAGTDSYTAQPLGGGAPSTGAATPGAFSFTTAGDWESVTLLDAGATPVAEFVAASCTQTGMTDMHGVVWTIERGTAGRKTVVQSPAANSARGLMLLGVNDWIDVPAVAAPPLDTYAPASSVVVVYRKWHNPGSFAHAIFTTKISAGPIGFALRFNTPAGSAFDSIAVSDTAASESQTLGAGPPPFGTRSALYGEVGNASPFARIGANAGSVAGDTVRNTTTSTSTGGAGRIGAYLNGSAAADMEFEALLTFSRALSVAEQWSITQHYAGGH